MKEDNLIKFKKLEAPSTTTTDLLTEITRHGTREMLAVALGAGSKGQNRLLYIGTI